MCELLVDGPDEELTALLEQYAELSTEEDQALEAESLRGMAGEIFELELDDGDEAAALSEEDLARVGAGLKLSHRAGVSVSQIN